MPLQEGLVAFWKLEESSGNRVDSSNNGYNLSEQGTVGSATGAIGNCADFTPTNYLYINNSELDGLNPGSQTNKSFSISLWANSDGFSGGEQALVSLWGATDRAFILKLYDDAGTLQSVVNVKTGGITVSIGHRDAHQPGEWHHYCMTFDALTGTVTWYLDYSDSIADSGNPVIGVDQALINKFCIGAAYNNGSPNLGFDGKIDAVGFWNKELSASEVQELYNSGVGLELSADGAEAGGDGPEVIEAFSPFGGAEAGGDGPEVIEAFSPFGGAEIGGEPEGDEEIGIGEVEFEIPRMFEWNVGNCTPYYYTVFGYCQELNCDDIPFDVRIYGGGEDCRRKIMVTVMGCSLKEVCLALKKYKLIFKIERIFKNHRPALTIDQDLWTDDPPLRLGEDPCRVYEEVYPGDPTNPFELPLECAEFFLEGDINETWGMHATAGFVSEDETEGGLEFDGDAEILSTHMTLKGAGGFEFDGDAELIASNYLGGFLTTWGVVSDYSNLEANLVEVDGDTLLPDETTIPNDCLCAPIPVMVRVTHNLSKTSLFTYFLERNSLELPSEVRLFYSRRTHGWYGNLHYDGWASSSPYGNNIRESWDLMFEWACTPEIGSVSMGNYVWKFGTYIRRRVGLEDYDTRIIVGFPTAGVCPPDVNLRFTFTLDTDTELITSTSSLYIHDVELLILFDNIGLFKSYAWKNSPNLIMNVSQHAAPVSSPTFDLGKLIPDVELQLNAPTQTPVPIFV